MVKKNFWLPVLWGFFICFVYGLRKIIPGSGDLYFPALYLIPIVLLISGKVKLSEMGFRIGRPVDGLFIALLLPVILFLRYKTMGRVWFLAPQWQALVIGSVGEEFFFRGYLQGQFEKIFGANFSLLLTNFFFMLVHVVKGYSLVSSLMIFIIGVYFSYGRYPKGGNSLFWSSIAHPLYNLIAITGPFSGR